ALLAAACAKEICPTGKSDCCRSTADCGPNAVCFPPAGFTCEIGYVGPSDCSADSECGADGVCEQVACEQDRGRNCVVACTADRNCIEGKQCAASGHCVPRACAAGCPPLFACDGSGICSRVRCQQDSDCPADGLCLYFACYSSLGGCGLII